eukprot:jgi/Tetstr1/438137/TSEL_002863.t1
MRKPIEINSRVAARRGPFKPAALGRLRQQRALKFGNVVESVASNKFRIRPEHCQRSPSRSRDKLCPARQFPFAPEVSMVSWRLLRRRWLSFVPQCPSPARGIRKAPNIQKYMPHWRFEQIRALVKFSKVAPGAGPDTWKMFT